MEKINVLQKRRKGTAFRNSNTFIDNIIRVCSVDNLVCSYLTSTILRHVILQFSEHIIQWL